LETGAQKDLPAWSHERERNRAATAYLVQAMAHHQLHHSKEAGETLAKAIEIIEKQCPKVDDGDLGREWPDWLFANILRREAESLIGDKSKTAGEIK
jgi:hypothetical protein